MSSGVRSPPWVVAAEGLADAAEGLGGGAQTDDVAPGGGGEAFDFGGAGDQGAEQFGLVVVEVGGVELGGE